MHSNEDDNPLYLFIQLKPYTHTFGRKMHVVETSIHMSFVDYASKGGDWGFQL